MKVEVTQISENIIEFTEYVDYGDGVPVPYVDAYLVVGKEKALLFDSLQETDDLYERVREYTTLPIYVLITHGHGDHAGASLPEFAANGCKIYMMESDIDPLLAYSRTLKREMFSSLLDGMTFDTGDYSFETIACPGHTVGSVVFVDRNHEIMFSGDSIGSGSLWMQIPGCLPISEYKASIDRLTEQVSDLKRLLIYPGHRNQSPEQLTLQYVYDTAYIVNGLIDGTVVGEERIFTLRDNTMKFMSASHGQMLDFCYDADRIK